MKRHDLQSVEISAPAREVFRYLADDSHLPEWTNAFAAVDGSRAVLRTPAGEIPVDLRTLADEEHGTVDTRMTFPDGSVGWAYSRVLPLGRELCVYTFTLTAPPVPLEALEGTLAEQSRILSEELRTLKGILERDRVSP